MKAVSVQPGDGFISELPFWLRRSWCGANESREMNAAMR
jgi:hypothetical protein